ncbi:unnamed protein product [Lathyrus oleraceus]
MCLYQITEI